ncbi:T9SS type A sorting domain-containing protein [Aquimarina aggregata]|uniref:T9SS type A sorting domain-containing protein n=1 Tax=Aquimarina aggregata TaxID=1642818 RepID=UPI003CD0D804
MYPNPSKDILNIGGIEPNDIIFIYDLMGRIVKKTQIDQKKNGVLLISDIAP